MFLGDDLRTLNGLLIMVLCVVAFVMISNIGRQTIDDHKAAVEANNQGFTCGQQIVMAIIWLLVSLVLIGVLVSVGGRL